MITHQIESFPIWEDIKDIFQSGPKDVKYELRGMIHTDKEDIPVFKIISLDIFRDYVNHIGDRILIEFKMPLGEYMARLYPYRRHLEFSLKRIILTEGAAGKKEDSEILVERYKAVFPTKENPNMGGAEVDIIDTESLNKIDVIDVKLDLLDRSIEVLRTKTTHGVFRAVTPRQVMHGVIGGEANKIQIDGKPAIDAMDIAEPNNTELSKQIVIKSGVHITNLPTYLQEHMGGVYNAGIGTYIQRYKKKKTCFIYPLFNIKRFDEDVVAKVEFYSLPSDRLQGIDRTFKVEGQIVKILANSARKYQDSADTDYMNNGVGFKMSDANAYMKKPVKITEEGPVGKRVNLNYEVGIEERQDGLNHAPMSDMPVSGNPYNEYSKVLARNVARIDLTWENADPDLIYPGMPCKYIFMMKDKKVELKGIISGIHILMSLQGKNFNSNTYKNVCALMLLVEKHHEVPELPKPKHVGVF